jgi:hypothetical protein
MEITTNLCHELIIFVDGDEGYFWRKEGAMLTARPASTSVEELVLVRSIVDIGLKPPQRL